MLKNQGAAQGKIQKIPRVEIPHFEVELTKSEDGQNINHIEENKASYEISAKPSEHTSIQNDQLITNRQRRQVKAPKRLGYVDLIAYALIAAQEVDQEEPKTYKEIVESKNSTHWIKAMQDEIDSLHNNGTWVLVQKPKGRKVVSCK